MKIIWYQCGCVALRAPEQADAVAIVFCKTEGPHTTTPVESKQFADLTKIQQRDYGYMIHKAINDAGKLRMIRRIITGEI